MPMKIKKQTVGAIGLFAVVLLCISLLVFGMANDNFHFLDDFISTLGAIGAPHALWFNLIGFMGVGLLLFMFGLLYGVLLKDKLLSLLLSLFGLGFAFTAIPIDLQADRSAVSKAHIVAICLGLAFWLFGLARLGYNSALSKRIRSRANIAAVVLTLAMIGAAFGLLSMPVAHRVIFGVVFGWTFLSSLDLLSYRQVNSST